MSSILIKNASVIYPVINFKADTLLSRVKKVTAGGSIQQSGKSVAITAIENLTLEVHDGDRLGILGQNGAGKTTLLRLITGVYAPVGGSIRVEGRISSLIDIQLGLNAHLNGYQNIKLRSLYMGIPEDVIEDRTESIAEFTELGEYLNLPLRTYSSGMRLRLAFAIATGYETDIMVMDEWLSAGDANFRDKAQERLKELIGNSKIFIMASHSIGLQAQMCNKGVVFKSGKIVFSGGIDEAVEYSKTV